MTDKEADQLIDTWIKESPKISAEDIDKNLKLLEEIRKHLLTKMLFMIIKGLFWLTALYLIITL